MTDPQTTPEPINILTIASSNLEIASLAVRSLLVMNSSPNASRMLNAALISQVVAEQDMARCFDLAKLIAGEPAP